MTAPMISRTRFLVAMLVAIGGLFALTICARANTRVVDTARSTITVHVSMSGVLQGVADDVVVRAPLLEGSLDENAATPHVQIVIDAQRLRVVGSGLSAADREQVQTRMLGPEVLDVEHFRWISFHSIESRRVDARRWLVQGELELHGCIRPMTVTVVDEGGRYKGSATVKQSDHGIAAVRIAGGTAHVKDEVRIDFDIIMR